MPIRRTYADHGDACAAAHALDVVGDRWSVVMIRELLLGPKRFSDLMAALHGITPAVLATRLRELEALGVLEPVVLPYPARVSAYRLTPWGREFEPILESLGRWAHASPTLPREGGLTPDGVVIAMRTMAKGNPARPIKVDLTLRDGRSSARTDVSYRLMWAAEGLLIEKLMFDKLVIDVLGPHVLGCDSSRWADLLFGPASSGRLETDLPDGLAASSPEAADAARRLIEQFRPIREGSEPPPAR